MKATLENNYLSDSDVANYARQSFGKLAENFSNDDNHSLIRFLARGMRSGDWDSLIRRVLNCDNGMEAHELLVYVRKIPEHWAPFAHPQLPFRLSAPIPIARQAFKHKIRIVESEESRRYLSYEPVIYFPEFWRVAAQDVKQGSTNEAHTLNAQINDKYYESCEKAKATYLWMIDIGVCPEQARLVLQQGTEVNWVLSGSLFAFSNLYNQRPASHAQLEIQMLAEQLGEIIAPLYPVSWPALTQGNY